LSLCYSGFLDWLPTAAEILDSREGYLLLKIGAILKVWNPLLRADGFINLPICQKEAFLAASLLPSNEFGEFGLVTVQLGTRGFTYSATDRCLILNLYYSRSGKWRRINSGVHLPASATLHPFSVRADNRIYFIMRRSNKEILQIDFEKGTAGNICLWEYFASIFVKTLGIW
jgi:hypothetical protein